MSNQDSTGNECADFPDGHDEDLKLVHAISAGSPSAWHSFLNKFSGLIYHAAKRYLPAENKDDIRSVYVDVLKFLYDGDLQKYHGRSSLSTWLFVYTSRKALDFWRAKHGRFRQPKGLEKLSSFDREVLQLYYMERMSLEIVIHTLHWNGIKISAREVVESILRIESALDPRYLNRLDHEYQARKKGVDDARMLNYLVHARVEYENQVASSIPDHKLMEHEAKDITRQIKQLIAKLPREERKALHLRFNEGLAANKISAKLGLGGQRKTYTYLDRLIRKLRMLIIKQGYEYVTPNNKSKKVL